MKSKIFFFLFLFFLLVQYIILPALALDIKPSTDINQIGAAQTAEASNNNAQHYYTKKKMPSVSPLSSSKSDALLMPRIPAKKPKKILIPQKGVYKNIIIVKLVEGSKARLRGKVLKSFNSFLSNQLKTSIFNLNNLILKPDVKEIKRLFTRPHNAMKQ